MSGSRHDVRVIEGGRMNSRSHETTDVSHVEHEERVDLLSDPFEALGVEVPAVGRSSRDEELGAVAHGEIFHLIVVDETSLLIQPVREALEVLGDSADLLRRSLIAWQGEK